MAGHDGRQPEMSTARVFSTAKQPRLDCATSEWDIVNSKLIARR